MPSGCRPAIMLLAGAAILVWPADPSADPDLAHPEPVIEWGAEWSYVGDGSPLDPAWYRSPDPTQAHPELWMVGPAPFVGRSTATQDAIEAEQRRIRRRRRRRGRRYSPPEFTGTRLLYDSALFGPEGDGSGEGASALAEVDPGVEAGPNTYYFHRTFRVDRVDEVVSVFFEARFSGGFVAYLNGREWLRHNVDPGQTASRPADIVWQPDWVAQTVGNIWQRAFTGLDPAFLREGENHLAVEVHRRDTGGSQAMHFDAQLRVYRHHDFVKAPYLQAVQHRSVTVMWETNVPAIGYVEYGSGDRLERVATSPEVASTLHEVTLTDLEPDTRYFYRVHTLPARASDGAEPLSSPVYHFRTAVTPGTPFTFLAYGDNRSNDDVHADLMARMLERAEQEDARFFLNTGDLTTRASWWDEWQDEFFRPAAPMMVYYPLYAALGNHEGNHETWYEYLSLPNNESWYSFSYGDVDFFAMNSSTAFYEGSAQYEWMDAALTASDANWKVVFFHHPPFACVPSRKPGNEYVQEHIVPLLERHGVDLVLLGHDHLYGRSVPINGVTYVITGGGGASTYPAEPDAINPICVQVHHFCVIRVSPESLQLEAISIEGEVLDTFTLTH